MRKLFLVGLMFLTSITTFAQISGKVIDGETNDVLTGATIVVSGTTEGTVTGFDGTFSIDVGVSGNSFRSFLYWICKLLR